MYRTNTVALWKPQITPKKHQMSLCHSEQQQKRTISNSSTKSMFHKPMDDFVILLMLHLFAIFKKFTHNWERHQLLLANSERELRNSKLLNWTCESKENKFKTRSNDFTSELKCTLNQITAHIFHRFCIRLPFKLVQLDPLDLLFKKNHSGVLTSILFKRFNYRIKTIRWTIRITSSINRITLYYVVIQLKTGIKWFIHKCQW